MIKLVDKTTFIRQLRAIRKYFMKAYKQFIFEVVDEMKRQAKEDGFYSTTLDIDEIFNKVYGQLKVNYMVENGIVYVENFEPADMLNDMYFRLLPTYEGIPYRNEKDLFKIKLLKGV